MYSDQIEKLFSEQLQEWKLARTNYSQLEKVRIRKFSFGTFEVLVQFNPERIRSSSAKVDTRSIGERPCFLCAKNRPSEQIGIDLVNNLTILVNPFPIFKRHLTIPSGLHTDQRIGENFDTMLSLAEAMPLFTVFYNGPQCGASAPDHLHFQAGNIGFMPVENDFLRGRHTRLLSSEQGMEIWKWESYLRGLITMKGSDRNKMVRVFDRLFDRLSGMQPGRPEPMLNILTGFSPDEWTIHIFPRKQHRPRQFFAEGDSQIMISPAAVDLGGVIITPREEDFIRITKDDIEDIFRQVSFNESELDGLINEVI